MSIKKKKNKEKNKEKEFENHLDKKVSKWFAVYTKYKREKIVRQLLEEKGIEVYLPLLKFTRRYVRKVKKVELPLFNCYVFVKIVQDEYLPVLQTEHVLKFIRIAKNLISIPDEEIQIVKRIVGENIEVLAESNTFYEGDYVEIIGGNLTGLKGKLIEKYGKKEMVVELTNMGYSLRMNVDVSLLRKIQKPAID